MYRYAPVRPPTSHRREAVTVAQALALAVWLALGLLSAPVSVAADTDGLARLQELWREVRYIAYTPRGFDVVDSQVTRPSAESVRADLELLRGRFDGLVTYSAWNGHEHIPALAAELGYRSLIIGVWDPGSEEELGAAIRAAREHPGLVHALLIGNEGLAAGRYSLQSVLEAMARARAALPGVAVSTVEPFVVYLRGNLPGFIEAQDFLCPNVHPIYESWFGPGTPDGQLVEVVLEASRRLRALGGRPLLLHETGVPSGPPGSPFDPERQQRFWAALTARAQPGDFDALVWFEAFDAPWKQREAERSFGGVHPEEAYWGFYQRDGTPKPVSEIPGLTPPGPGQPPRTDLPGCHPPSSPRASEPPCHCVHPGPHPHSC